MIKGKSFTKVVLGVLLVGAIGLVAGCTQEKKPTAKKEKITIFQSKVEITDDMIELAKVYEDETGVEVEIWETTGDDYIQQLKTKLSNKESGPSIFSITQGSESEQLESYLYDMSEAKFAGDIAPSMDLKLADKLVGLPYGVEGYGFIYNKDLVSEADFKDYEAFVAMLKKEKEAGISGVELSQESHFLIGHLLNTPFALVDNPEQFVEDLTAGTVKMSETQEFKDFAQIYEAIREYTTNPLEINYDKQIGNFATGKSSAIHQGNWATTMFNDYEIDFSMGMAPFPQSGNQKLAVSVPSYWAVNSNKDEAEAKLAVEFLEWLVGSETGQEYIVDKFKFIPAMTNIEAKNLDELSQAVFDASSTGETIPWIFPNFPFGIIDADFVPIAQEFFSTPKMTGDDFLTKLDEAWAKSAEEK